MTPSERCSVNGTHRALFDQRHAPEDNVSNRAKKGLGTLT